MLKGYPLDYKPSKKDIPYTRIDNKPKDINLKDLTQNSEKFIKASRMHDYRAAINISLITKPISGMIAADDEEEEKGNSEFKKSSLMYGDNTSQVKGIDYEKNKVISIFL